MLKAIIMDFDGVIVDTEIVWYDIYAEWFLKNKNYHLPIQEFLICVGSSSADLLNLLEKRHCIVVDRKQFFRDIQESFIEQSNKLPAKNGVTQFIREVKSEGLKLALATSSTRLKPITHLTRLGLINKFDELITAEDVERIKPNPDLFLKAAKKLGVVKDNVLIIEDSLNGLIAGVNAGMRVLVVPNKMTKDCDFTGCYKKMESLEYLDLKKIMRDF